ncbi:MAG: fatty acid desaturase [Flammeovirgaceae bacterium]|nr:fatty acid desaturase [Flammeovirgaceae bacterium]|tara:strand:+ start:1909 stop:2865 length:957 start_codon:yes stop_codon:yes gene_type:complete
MIKFANMERTTEFIWKEDKEPHFHRRKQILKEVPEVKDLFGIDPWLKYKVLFVSFLHLGVSFFVPENIWGFIAVTLLVGTTLVHILVLAVHELSHDLAFDSEAKNNWLAIIVNLPLLFPFAMAFKTYHLEHHWKQGEDKIDTDLPSKWEVKAFRGFIGKLFWMIFQTSFYAIRPLFIYPRKPNKWEIINLITQLSFVGIYFYFFGWLGLLYMFFSIGLATGLHPLGGHFVSEHYVTKEGQETYSYYGPLNKIVFNVGYHNEHHDFPNVPGSRLPKLKKVAGQYYDDLHYYNSWTGVILNFLTNKKVGLNARVKRKKAA